LIRINNFPTESTSSDGFERETFEKMCKFTKKISYLNIWEKSNKSASPDLAKNSCSILIRSSGYSSNPYCDDPPGNMSDRFS